MVDFLGPHHPMSNFNFVFHDQSSLSVPNKSNSQVDTTGANNSAHLSAQARVEEEHQQQPSNNSDGLEAVSVEDNLPIGWQKKRHIRKSGASAGKSYFTFYSPCGQPFKSKKKALQFAEKSQSSAQSPNDLPTPNSFVSNKDETKSTASGDDYGDDNFVDTFAKNSYGALDHKSYTVRYFEVEDCGDTIDNAAFEDLVKEHELIPWKITGTDHHRQPNEKKMHPHNTASIAIILSEFALGRERKLFRNEIEVKEFFESINSLISKLNPTGLLGGPVKQVVADFTNELSYMYNRKHHSIDWYLKLFDVINKLLGISIFAILPPYGGVDDYKSRVYTFKSGSMTPGDLPSNIGDAPHMVLRLLIDRTQLLRGNGAIGDSGNIVAGVAGFTKRENNDFSNSDSVSLGSEDSSTSSASVQSLSSASGDVSGDDGQVFDNNQVEDRKLPAVEERKMPARSAVTTSTSPPESVAVDHDSGVARNLFTTPVTNKSPVPNKAVDSDEVSRLREQLRQAEQQRDEALKKNSTVAVQEKVAKGELNQSVKNESGLVATVAKPRSADGGGQGCSSVGGGSGWGNFGSGNTESIIKGSPLKGLGRTSVVSVEFTHPITDLTTGGRSCVGLITNVGQPGWWLKGAYMTRVAKAYFHNVLNNKDIPNCFDLNDAPIKAVIYGNNTLQRRQKPGRSNYAIMKMYMIFKYPSAGFPIETYVEKFEGTIRNMFVDSRVPAVLAVHSIRETSSNMYNGFMSGSFREKSKRGVAYKNEEELTKDLQGDLETTFKYGLGAKSYDHTLNKYMTDHFIKTYLTELGYNSFDDVRESEKHYIYRNGEFPVWDSIEEDQLTE